MDRLNVLINAYAIAPSWGSEQGMGWNWVINLAMYSNVFVITEGEYKDEIEDAVKSLPQSSNLHFFYLPLPDKVRKMCWNQGDWRFYYYYRRWQKKAYNLEKKIISENEGVNSIDVVHHLNMIGFREPGFEWKHQGVVYAWGPVGGMELTPTQFLSGEPLTLKIAIRIKNLINNLQRKYQPNVRKAIRNADILTCATKGVYEFVRDYHHKDVILINETGCYEQKPHENTSIKDTFDIVWVGKFDFRKQVGLAIEILKRIQDCDKVRLHIIGPGSETETLRFHQLANNLLVEDKIIWHGRIPHDKVQELMRNSDVFLMTSIMEGTPHVVLEAIQNSLPVICFDTCGQAGVVNDSVGIKIQMYNREQAINDFAESIRKLYANPSLLKTMSHNCVIRQKELSWGKKAEYMTQLYRSAVSEKQI